MDSEFAFPSAFSWDLDPEFPGSGSWDVPVFGFDRAGAVTSEFESRWGTPLIVRFRGDAIAWVGMFASGGLGGIRTVAPCPSPTMCCLLADGLAYCVDVDHPEDGATIATDQVTDVVAMAVPPLLLLASFSDVVAIGSRGVAWRSPRVFVDDLSIQTASADGIVCTGLNFGGSPTVRLDPENGEQMVGTTMRDLGWPES